MMEILAMHFRFLLISLIIAASVVASGVSAEPLSAPPAQVSVDISGLVSHLATLPPDETEEQVRDWAMYGLKNELGVPTGDEVPIRHPALKDTSPGEVSKGRVFAVSKKEWAVLLPKNLVRDKATTGGLIDKRYAETNTLPEKVSIFSYEVPAGGSAIEIHFDSTVAATELFGPAYGYFTASVTTLPDMKKFLERADDVVMVQWSPKGLSLGGRSYGHDVRRTASLEEIAAIYQAYNASRQQRDQKIGFSLDLDLDYDAFAVDMEEFARTSDLMKERDFAGSSAAEIVSVAGQIRSGRSQTPLIQLLRRLAASGTKTDFRVYSALYSIQQHHTFQMARYDGNLQGTQAGMVLFYTDLLAKMWAMDYEGMSAAMGVNGFRPMTQIAIPKLYWAGYGRAANTRLWFGLKRDGFDVYGDKALFQPIATRVYAASSDLLTPGKEESTPNFQSKEFLGWWDRHYEAVADYEPGYHKLNQIQKWSSIFLMLKVNNLRHLDFLLNVPVQRDLVYESWSKGNDRLKTKMSVAFLDKKKYGHRTECLPLLQSKPHPFLGGYGMISGGITLATQSDIQAKMQKTAETATPASVAAGTAENSAVPIPFPFGRQRRPVQESTSAPSQAAPTPAPQKGKVVAETQQEAPRAQGSNTEAAAKEPAAEATGKKRIKLGWEKSPSLEVVTFVNALASLQQPNVPGSKNETIFRWVPTIQSVVRISQWDTYLVKVSTIKDMWIYLKINPAQVGDYPAKAAGSFAEADIFGARLIPAVEAEQLAVGKTLIK